MWKVMSERLSGVPSSSVGWSGAVRARVEAVLAAYEAAPIRGAKAARARKVFETLNPKVVGRMCLCT